MKTHLDSSWFTTFLKKHLIILFWLLAIILAVFQSFNPRHVIDPDGVSYLDMGDALMRGDWFTAVNGLWSPLYAWILGVTLWVLRPSAYWEFFDVQLVNLMIYGVALVSFHFFLRELIQFHHQRMEQRQERGWVRLPTWGWWALGYTVFIWSSLNLITVLQESPDLLVAALAYLIVGIVLRIGRGNSGWQNFAWLGFLLGVGYWAKGFMFAIAFIVIAMSTASLPEVRRNWRTTMACAVVAFVAFFVVATPLIALLSIKYDRLTFSDQGRITYLMHVNRVPFVHWQGGALKEGDNVGLPSHPSRKIFTSPDVYEFAGPIGGSYSSWLDPTYWFEGMSPKLNIKSHWRILQASITIYYNIFMVGAGSLLAGYVALLVLSSRGRRVFRDHVEGWPLLIPGVATLGLFSLVHVEPRYTGAFVAFVLLGLLSGVRLPDTAEARRAAMSVIAGVTVVMLIVTAFSPLYIAYSAVHDALRARDPWPRENWHVAQGLSDLGLHPNDWVAVMGNGFRASAWARLGRYRIVAELPPDQVAAFWALDSIDEARVIQTLAATGAKVVVAKDLPQSVTAPEWHRIGDTDYYAYFLSR